MEVEFEYTHSVHSPFWLRGIKGHVRRLKIADAQMLAEQGYGRITNLHPGGPSAKPEPVIDIVEEIPKRNKRNRKKKTEQKEGEDNDGPEQPAGADEDGGEENQGSDI
jgi:hypothetical protein